MEQRLDTLIQGGSTYLVYVSSAWSTPVVDPADFTEKSSGSEISRGGENSSARNRLALGQGDMVA
jgi:hypothetical protein